MKLKWLDRACGVVLVEDSSVALKLQANQVLTLNEATNINGVVAFAQRLAAFLLRRSRPIGTDYVAQHPLMVATIIRLAEMSQLPIYGDDGNSSMASVREAALQQVRDLESLQSIEVRIQISRDSLFEMIQAVLDDHIAAGCPCLSPVPSSTTTAPPETPSSTDTGSK